ncbi:MAG: hypothetical protein QXW20_08425 [Ignisphaera sp.]
MDITIVAQYGVAIFSIYLLYRIVIVYMKRQNQLIEENTRALNNLSRLIERNIVLIEQIARCIRDDPDNG